MGMNPKTKRGK